MPPTKKRPGNIYSVHPGITRVQDWIASLPEKTGRSLEQWVKLVKKHAPSTESECRAWLQKSHGPGANAAWWIADRAEGKPSEDDSPEAYLATAEKYVEAMYAGGKAGLRPIHDRLIELGRGLGPDVKICPCKTIVPFYRKHVFAQIEPSTRTRIDFGLALGDAKATDRLIGTGGFARKDRITHKIEIGSLDEIDAEVNRWLQAAYQRDA